MNKPRMLNLVRAVRETQHAEQFTMERYAHRCGTPACILGNYAARTDLQDLLVLATPQNQYMRGAQLLFADTGGPASYDCLRVLEHFDITDEQADRLFSQIGCGNAQTPVEAIAFLESFIEKH